MEDTITSLFDGLRSDHQKVNAITEAQTTVIAMLKLHIAIMEKFKGHINISSVQLNDFITDEIEKCEALKMAVRELNKL